MHTLHSTAPRLAACTLGVLLLPAPRVFAGQFTYITQERTISAAASDGINMINVSNSASAPDFGPFNDEVSASVGIGSASASMRSFLDPVVGFFVDVQVSASGSANFDQGGAASATFGITFDVSETTFGVFEFSSLGGGFGFSGPDNWINPFADLPPLVQFLPPTPITFIPGRYSFGTGLFISEGNGSNGNGSAATLVIPAPHAPLVFIAAGPFVMRRRR